MDSITPLMGLALATLLAWLFLLAFRGGFWRADQRLPRARERETWPAVAVIVPARDEADVVGGTVAAILGQDYPGPLHLVLVDDQSGDGTAEVAHRAAAGIGQEDRLTVLTGEALPPGWSGKLWALDQGIGQARRALPEAAYFWLSDADILAAPDTLRRLVAKAEDDGRDLVSLMARLESEGFWARLLIPPFVLFFQKLYPFRWSNDPRARTAAAAGGCILVRRETFEAAGGYPAIRSALIDDCALARLMKAEARKQGRGIWLGLTESVHSHRPYQGLGEIWKMVARTAYTQLDHSPLLLAGTLLGMVFLYLAAPLILLTWPLHGNAPAALLAAAAWLLMALAARPTYRIYQEPFWRGLSLPLAGLLYTAMTFDSARRHWLGQGGQWKGRAQAHAKAVAERLEADGERG